MPEAGEHPGLLIVRWMSTDTVKASDRPALERLLSRDEAERASAFRADADRLAFTAAHALARRLLEDCTGRTAASWRFDRGSHGKPSPISIYGEPDVRVNISHTRSLVAVAASVGREVGIDAEWLGRTPPLDLVDRVFTAEEREILTSSPSALQTDVFFTLWTLKEAYSKALGRGMTLPFDSFAFALNPVRLLYSGEDDTSARWSFALHRTDGRHIVATAVEATSQMHIDCERASVDRLFSRTRGP